MKPSVTLFFSLICIQLFACNKNGEVEPNFQDTNSTKMKITIGAETFTATFVNSETATAFRARLPLTINMKELNGNEKYFDLPNVLPAHATNTGAIQSGDLMLYGTNTLVLFYKTFSTTYDYSRIARIDNPSRLSTALGPGNTTVKFELE